mgnify:CR=1 FL=1
MLVQNVRGNDRGILVEGVLLREDRHGRERQLGRLDMANPGKSRPLYHCVFAVLAKQVEPGNVLAFGRSVCEQAVVPSGTLKAGIADIDDYGCLHGRNIQVGALWPEGFVEEHSAYCRNGLHWTLVDSYGGSSG